MKIHKSITMERIMDMIEESNSFGSSPGACIACGEEADGVEPDARRYECEACGENQVFGAEELLFEIGVPEL